MLKELFLNNYRGFKVHKLPIEPKTMIVGANNAGKSTLVEAFRLISIVANRFENLTYRLPDPDVGIAESALGVSPSIADLDINFDNLFHQLGDPPAVITAKFTGGESIEIHVGRRETIHAVIKDSSGDVVRNRHEARSVSLPQIQILPQIGPLLREEKVLGRQYVRARLSSSLASLHFRNQLNAYPEYFEAFSQFAEATWEGLRIIELVGKDASPGSNLGLLIEDSNYVAEVAWMGHGLQMWLQTVWFLARVDPHAVIILDEPDVYLHPDLQRKLARLVHNRFPQVIISTHSPEMMSEVDPSHVLVVNRFSGESKFVADDAMLQRVVDNLGSGHNLNLSRIRTSRGFLQVEGDDSQYLEILHRILFPQSPTGLSKLGTLPIGGWGGWDIAAGSSWAIHNYMGEEIRAYCILDSDYHTPQQISARYQEAKQRRVQLHIWNRKEIENYLLVPSAIQRLIVDRSTQLDNVPAVGDISSKIEDIADSMRDEVIDGFGNEFLNDDRKRGFATARKRAEELVGNSWSRNVGKLEIPSGKGILSKLSSWSQETYGVSFGPMAIARNITAEEIPSEIRQVITALERSSELIDLRQGESNLTS